LTYVANVFNKQLLMS